jgi:Putative peptidoglycan binding domain
VRERRAKNRRFAGAGGGATGALAAVGLRLWSSAAQRPVDAGALICTVAASLIIVVNAIFLQSGVHPAPFFANPTVQTSTNRASALSSGPTTAKPAATSPVRMIDTAPARPSSGGRTQAAASARRSDPIGDLIGGSSPAPASTASVGGPARIAAVQRALSEYGYGQLRLSGTLDEPTVAAIQKFEADRKLPVTGRLSDRLLSELSGMTGRSIP